MDYRFSDRNIVVSTLLAEFGLNVVDPVVASYQSAVAQFPQSNGDDQHVPGTWYQVLIVRLFSSRSTAILLGVVSKDAICSSIGVFTYRNSIEL